MSSQPNCVSCPININLADWVNENCRHLLCFKHSAEDNGRCAVCSLRGKVFTARSSYSTLCKLPAIASPWPTRSAVAPRGVLEPPKRRKPPGLPVLGVFGDASYVVCELL
jgi:hypothetical protein